METRLATCRACGEQDYLDFTATIDGVRYCQGCWHEKMEQGENDAIAAWRNLAIMRGHI